MKLLLNYGTRLQKSVYECRITKEQLDELKDGLKAIVEHCSERLRFWEICKNCSENSNMQGWVDFSYEEETFWIV